MRPNGHLSFYSYITCSVSEENKFLPFEEREGWEYFWCVDPLDGTKVWMFILIVMHCASSLLYIEALLSVAAEID